MIRYKITSTSPSAHLFDVELHLDEPGAGELYLTLPAWIPGSYMIRDFARNLVTISARTDGEQVALEKVDKQTWRVETHVTALQISYQVYAWDLSVRGAHLDQTHGYFNGTSVFLKVVGREHEPCEIEIARPAGPSCGDWRVATTLSRVAAPELGFGTYRANDYEDLIDHPVEMGTFDFRRFRAAGIDHEIAVTGRHRADLERLCSDLKRICEYHAEMFGGLPEMPRYLFLVTAVGEGYGGLEHSTSTSLLCKRDDLPKPGEQGVSEGYRRFLGLCSHEYFHLWNVKRIRPQALRSADLMAESYTRQLWAFEGITSYYDDITLVRSGLVPVQGYLEVLAKTITRVMRGSGRLKQSVSDSSFDAWIKFYKQDENAPNAVVSYYAKGSLVAFALDMKIRSCTGDERTLDDLMRVLWDEYGAPDVAIPEGGVEEAAERVAGEPLGEFFDQALRGTGDLPLRSLFESVGVGFSLRPQKGARDDGGCRSGDDAPVTPGPALGARYKGEAVGLRLESVFDGGTAQASGLAAGDLLVAVDGLMVQEGTIESILARLGVGASATAHAFRRDELMTFEMKLMAAPNDTCELWLIEEIDGETLDRRKAWLGLEG